MLSREPQLTLPNVHDMLCCWLMLGFYELIHWDYSSGCSESQLWSYSKHQQDRQIIHHSSSLFLGFWFWLNNITYVFQVFICGQITIHNRGQNHQEEWSRRSAVETTFWGSSPGSSGDWGYHLHGDWTIKKSMKISKKSDLTWFNHQEVSRHGDFSPRKWWCHGYVGICWYYVGDIMGYNGYRTWLARKSLN